MDQEEEEVSKKRIKVKSPARVYFDRITHYRKGMHYSLASHLSGFYNGSKRGQQLFPDVEAFSDAKEILGAAVKAEASGRTPYARLLGLIGLKVLAVATHANAIGARQ